jgi:hypothetical protein
VSSEKKPVKGFGNQLASLSGRGVKEEQQTPANVEPESDPLETFSSHMTKGRKRRLKMAATREDRKIYEIVGELVETYLRENHPDLK